MHLPTSSMLPTHNWETMERGCWGECVCVGVGVCMWGVLDESCDWDIEVTVGF